MRVSDRLDHVRKQQARKQCGVAARSQTKETASSVYNDKAARTLCDKSMSKMLAVRSNSGDLSVPSSDLSASCAISVATMQLGCEHVSVSLPFIRHYR